MKLFLLSLLPALGILLTCFLYFHRQNKILENAAATIRAWLDGDADARIDCDREGALYRLFHEVNTLAAVLNAHAANELREKDFLKGVISDISHQLKTPLAALSIYNSLIQDETSDLPSVQELALLSEQELDRLDTLVQNLLKIAKLDAGSIIFDRTDENVADMMREVELHFSYRAEREQKEISLSGPDDAVLRCDRIWLSEAVGNIVKNALDHTQSGAHISICWTAYASAVRITVKDNGCGIHPEDLYHIFERFYRSRFSKDTEGAGLGLPLAKAIVEAHGGTVEVDSTPGQGTVFSLNFLTSPDFLSSRIL